MSVTLLIPFGPIQNTYKSVISFSYISELVSFGLIQHVMLVDGNDDRGIDVGIMTGNNFDIGGIECLGACEEVFHIERRNSNHKPFLL